MPTSNWITWSAAVALAFVTATARAESADAASDVSRAESYAAEAFDAYSRADYANAVTLYRLALDAAPSADIVYNLARIYDAKLKERDLAADYYRRYTEDPAADPNRLRVATQRLATLRELDRVQHELATRPPLSPAPEAASSPTSARATERPSSGLTGLQVSGILAGAAGIAGVAVGVGFGLDARSKADVTHGLCDGNMCMEQRGVDAAREASRSATISTISLIAGGALLAAGITLLAAGGRGGDEREEIALHITPYAAPSALGTQLAGRW